MARDEAVAADRVRPAAATPSASGRSSFAVVVPQGGWLMEVPLGRVGVAAAELRGQALTAVCVCVAKWRGQRLEGERFLGARPWSRKKGGTQ